MLLSLYQFFSNYRLQNFVYPTVVYARQFSGENIQQINQNKSRSKDELGNLQQPQINVITQFPGIQNSVSIQEKTYSNTTIEIKD